MNEKPRLTHEEFWEMLRQMTPMQRWEKACEITERQRVKISAEIRSEFPGLTQSDFIGIYRRRVEEAEPVWFCDEFELVGKE